MIHCITVNFACYAVGYVLVLSLLPSGSFLHSAYASLSATYKHPHMHQGCES